VRRRDFFFSSAGAASPLFNTAVGAETRGPNVLLLLTRSGDDALRRLAVEGTSFTRCYTTNPARAASLASLVTGRYPHAAAKADKLAALLEAAGYAACRDDPPSVVFISTTRSRPFYVEAAGEIRPWLDALDAAKLARETLVFAATLPDETAEATPFDRSCRLPLFIRWPGHFRGVATIVTILFNAVRPDLAFFGQKDAQQVAMIKRLTTDLGFETEIVVVPTVREESGLALSSRNRILSPEEREKAAVIFAALREAKIAFKQGERNAAKLIEMVQERIGSEPMAAIDYVSIVDPRTLEPLEKVGETETLIAAAVRFGNVRLIDNIVLNRGQ